MLVTGLPRCGSSWVGQVLSRGPGVRYRYEPFNPHWMPALDGRLGHFRYQRPGSPGPERLRRAADRALSGRQSAKQLARALYRGYAPAALRRRGRLVVKDPTACLLAGWLRERWNGRVLVLVRHPCGFASSIHALGWPLRLRRLLDQRPLVRDHLAEWAGLLRRCEGDSWASLAAWWSAVHFVLDRQAGDGWLFHSYEALCLDPEAGFERLARELGLASPPHLAQGAHRDDPGSTRKDSARMSDIWRTRMTPAQVDTVMEVVETFGLGHFSGRAGPQESA